VLEKRDFRVIKGVKVDDVWKQSWDWWQRSGFALSQRGPAHFLGSSYYSKIGLRREVEIRLQESDNTLYVDLSFRARITDEGAVGGAVTAVLFWPVAAVGGAISWSEYEDEANRLITNYWHFLSQVTGKPSQIPPGAPPPPLAPSTPAPPSSSPTVKKCSQCGSDLDANWRTCPFCGKPIK